MLCRPVLLFLATSFLLGDPEGLIAHEFAVSRYFFVLLALVEAWLCGIDLVLGHGITGANAWNVASLMLFVALAASTSRRLHEAGMLLARVLFLVPLILRGMAVQP